MAIDFDEHVESFFVRMARAKLPTANRTLRRLRVEEKGWSKEELSRVARVSAQTIRKAERGWPISEVSMGRIAKALGVSLQKLFPDAEP
jgi:transcriptional regulator with XRE-family HTH domain